MKIVKILFVVVVVFLAYPFARSALYKYNSLNFGLGIEKGWVYIFSNGSDIFGTLILFENTPDDKDPSGRFLTEVDSCVSYFGKECRMIDAKGSMGFRRSGYLQLHCDTDEELLLSFSLVAGMPALPPDLVRIGIKSSADTSNQYVKLQENGVSWFTGFPICDSSGYKKS